MKISTFFLNRDPASFSILLWHLKIGSPLTCNNYDEIYCKIQEPEVRRSQYCMRRIFEWPRQSKVQDFSIPPIWAWCNKADHLGLPPRSQLLPKEWKERRTETKLKTRWPYRSDEALVWWWSKPRASRWSSSPKVPIAFPQSPRYHGSFPELFVCVGEHQKVRQLRKMNK